MQLQQILKIHQKFAKSKYRAVDVLFAFTEHAFETRITDANSMLILRTGLAGLPPGSYPMNTHLSISELTSLITKLGKKEQVDFSLMRPLRPVDYPSFVQEPPAIRYRPTTEEMGILRSITDGCVVWSETGMHAYTCIDRDWPREPLYYTTNVVARMYGHTLQELMSHPPAERPLPLILIPSIWLQLLPVSEQQSMSWQGGIIRRWWKHRDEAFLHAQITSVGDHLWELEIHDALYISAVLPWSQLRARADMVIQDWGRHPQVSLTLDASEFLAALDVKGEHYIALASDGVSMRTTETGSQRVLLRAAVNGMLSSDIIQLQGDAFPQTLRKTLRMDARYQRVTLRLYRREPHTTVTLEFSGEDASPFVQGVFSDPPDCLVQRSLEDGLRAIPPVRQPNSRPLDEMLYRMQHVTGMRRALSDFFGECSSPIKLFSGKCHFAFGVFWIEAAPQKWCCWNHQQMCSVFGKESFYSRQGYEVVKGQHFVQIWREIHEAQQRVVLNTGDGTLHQYLSEAEILQMYDWIVGMIS